MSKAAIAVDDWKLPVFRKRLAEAGFNYEDAGELSPNVTVLTVPYEGGIASLARVVQACQNECERSRYDRKS